MLGASLFRYTQLRRAILGFSHIFSPFWHWKMWVKYSEIFPQFLGHVGMGHDSRFAVTFPVSSYLAAIFFAHLGCCGGAFLVAAFRVSQSTWEWDISCRVSNLWHRDRKGGVLRWCFLLFLCGWCRICLLVWCFFSLMYSWVFLKRVFSSYLGCYEALCNWILIPGIWFISTLSLCHTPNWVWHVSIMSRFDCPGVLLHGARTRLEVVLGFYVLFPIWGWSGLRGMSIYFHCPWIFYYVDTTTCYCCSPLLRCYIFE